VQRLAAPAGFLGPFRTDELARTLYAEGAGIFRIIPMAVAVPADTDDLVRLVRWAAASSTPLIPRGAGSGMPGGNVGPGVVVDLTHGFRAPPMVDAERCTVRAATGLTYRDVNDAAVAHGLRLPPDPSSGAFCTVGGMVATNAAGSRSHRYGAVRGWVGGLWFVTADGERGSTHRRTAAPPHRTAAEQRLLTDALPYLQSVRGELERAVPQTRKNSSGYCFTFGDDLVTDLLAGSEGTLALITEAEFRLAPLPDEPSTLLVTLRSLDDIAPAIAALEQFQPAAIELLDRTYLDFVRAAAASRVPSDTEAVLLVEFEHVAQEAAGAMAAIASSTDFAESAEAASRLWELRHLASPILAGLPDGMRSLQVIEDGCVPLTRLPAYIAGLRRIAADGGFEIVIFGHAGDGHVHANLLADARAADLAGRLERCLEEASELQIALGGTPAGEHGDGRLRAGYLERRLGATYVEACRRVKQAFDPAGILNPGVKLPGAGGPTITAELLKVGAGAPAVPDKVARVLREIERTVAYGVSRLELLEK
jgi:FAD/FMN-containing dehydrogenase